MRPKPTAVSAVLVAAVWMAGAGEGASEPSLPLIGGKRALAMVNGEPITLDLFYEQLATLHEDAAEPSSKMPRQRPWEMLERLVTSRLIVSEARNMGLAELAEIQQINESFRRSALKSLLFGRHAQKIARGDRAQADRLFREAVREYRVRSILLESEEDAKTLHAQVNEGGRFEAIIGELIEAGRGRSDDEARFFKGRQMLPQVSGALATMKVGEVSPILRLDSGYTVMKLLEVRYPEDPSARARAEAEALEIKRDASVREYVESLKSKYAKVDRKLLDRLDFEAPEPGFERLAKDERVIARIQGEAPVTVGDLADAVDKKFFHGTQMAIAGKRVNARLPEVFDEIVRNRVTLKEARRLGIDGSEKFKEMVSGEEESVLFGAFVQKVIDPEIKLTRQDLEEYLEEHQEEYTTPLMMRIEAIAFKERARAEENIVKLQSGADFQWMRANASGQAEGDAGEGEVSFDGSLIAVSTLPPELQKALRGAERGDYRLYGEGEGPFYVLHARDVFPASAQGLDEVGETIARLVFDRKRKEAIEEWASKLEEAYEVEMFVTGEQLDQILGIRREGKPGAGHGPAAGSGS